MTVWQAVIHCYLAMGAVLVVVGLTRLSDEEIEDRMKHLVVAMLAAMIAFLVWPVCLLVRKEPR